jgi:hypothetical protein
MIEFTKLGFTFTITSFFNNEDILLLCRPTGTPIEGSSQRFLDSFEEFTLKEYANVIPSQMYTETAEDLLLDLIIKYKYEHRLLPNEWFNKQKHSIKA